MSNSQNNHFLLDGFEWSFSRIETFSTCPYCFYLQYIQGNKSRESFFGQYGGFVHEILEDFNKGKLFAFELVTKYKEEYNDKITAFITDKISKNYYDKGYEFFENFEEPDYEVLCSEGEYKFKIGEYNFTGKIDVETENAIVDYKTKKGSAYKRKPKNNPDIREMMDGRFIDLSQFKQLYIYCVPYYNKHGRYPKKLVLEMVKENDRYELEFNMDDFELCKKLLVDEIHKIYGTTKFIKNENEFWCNNICGQRFNCKFEGE